mmetsp:Transcript_22702/g.59156  ORF Transcript_22702/g.59156 Transcript_22702/m.59156 type:complete len:256 (-) Transcript_22702:169-936(-)
MCAGLRCSLALSRRPAARCSRSKHHAWYDAQRSLNSAVGSDSTSASGRCWPSSFSSRNSRRSMTSSGRLRKKATIVGSRTAQSSSRRQGSRASAAHCSCAQRLARHAGDISSSGGCARMVGMWSQWWPASMSSRLSTVLSTLPVMSAVSRPGSRHSSSKVSTCCSRSPRSWMFLLIFSVCVVAMRGAAASMPARSCPGSSCASHCRRRSSTGGSTNTACGVAATTSAAATPGGSTSCSLASLASTDSGSRSSACL